MLKLRTDELFWSLSGLPLYETDKPKNEAEKPETEPPWLCSYRYAELIAADPEHPLDFRRTEAAERAAWSWKPEV